MRRGEGKLGETGGRPDQQQVQEDGAWGQYLRLPGRGVGCVCGGLSSKVQEPREDTGNESEIMRPPGARSASQYRLTRPSPCPTYLFPSGEAGEDWGEEGLPLCKAPLPPEKTRLGLSI